MDSGEIFLSGSALGSDSAGGSGGDSAAADPLLDGNVTLADDNLQLLRRIGVGGFSVVFLAEQRNPPRDVAVKVLRSSRASAALQARFVREAEFLARLNHPGIAQVYFTGEARDSAGQPATFVAMEYVAGNDLLSFQAPAEDASGQGESVVKDGPGKPLTVACREMSDNQKLRTFLEVLEAVEGAHQVGLIHRDLKPANILVNGEGRPKLLDFGLARELEPEPVSVDPIRTNVAEHSVPLGDKAALRSTDLPETTQSTGVVGTPEYMSPEQSHLSPSRLIDVRADIYSLGIILYELLVGRRPSEIVALHQLGRAYDLNTDPSGTWTQVGPELRAVVAKAMEPDRERRYGSVTALREDLSRYLACEPVSVMPPTAAYRMRKFIQKRPGMATLAASLLVALVAGLIMTSLYWRTEVERRRDQERNHFSNMANAVESAGRSGNWSAALKNVDHVLDIPSDSIGDEELWKLRIEKAKAEFVLSRKAASRKTLKSLREQVTDGPLRDRVLFWTGVVELGYDDNSLRWLREASLSTHLTSAEQHLAKALLSPNSGQTVEHLRTLLESEPFFPAAQQLLIHTLIFRGDRELAHREIAISKRVHPNDPNTAIAEAMLVALEAPPAEVQSRLQSILANLSEQQTVVPVLSGVLGYVATARRMIPAIVSSDGQDQDKQRQLIGQLLTQLLSAGAAVRPTEEEPYTTELAGHIWGGLLRQVNHWDLMEFSENQRPELIDRLLTTEPAGDAYAIRAAIRQEQRDLPGAEEDLSIARERPLFHESLLLVHLNLAFIQIERAIAQGPPFDLVTNDHLRRAIESLRRLCKLLEREADSLSTGELRLHGTRSVKACEWVGQTTLGLDILEVWQRRDRRNPEILLLRGDLLRNAQPPELIRALECYQQCLAAGPGSAVNRDQLVERIQNTQADIHTRVATIPDGRPAAPSLPVSE